MNGFDEFEESQAKDGARLLGMCFRDDEEISSDNMEENSEDHMHTWDGIVCCQMELTGVFSLVRRRLPKFKKG